MINKPTVHHLNSGSTKLTTNKIHDKENKMIVGVSSDVNSYFKQCIKRTEYANSSSNSGSNVKRTDEKTDIITRPSSHP